MFHRIAIAMFAAALLSGCIDADKPGLSADVAARFRLTDVEVVLSPKAQIHYSDAEDKATDAQAAEGAFKEGHHVDAAKVRAFELERTKSVIQKAFLNELGPKLAGSQPVKLRVTVIEFLAPGAFTTIILAGGSEMKAGIELLDAKSGDLIVGFDPSKGLGGAPGGAGLSGALLNPVLYSNSDDGQAGQMARNFADEYARWLLPQK